MRGAHALAIAAWAFFATFGAPAESHGAYLLVFSSAIGVTSASLAMTFVHRADRWWQWPVLVLVVISAVLSEAHRVVVGHPTGWAGVVSLMLILAFGYALLRLQFAYAAVAGALAIVAYDLTRVLVQARGDIGLVEPNVDLVAFAVVGTAAAFALERFARLLFRREREVDRERQRGDALLSNILPEVIIGRLKMRQGGFEDGRIAERYSDATVLFADLVGFTRRAADMDPDDLIVVLDDIFGRWDRLADRFGLEKIKTIGDAYMAAAGLPEPRSDHANAAAEMAIEIRDDLSVLRWPNGEAMSVRIGIASGVVIAGVIGRRKFAYDIWGDTVNLASRLQSTAAPGSIQVSDAVYSRLRGAYHFSQAYEVDVKGKGRTIARTLVDRLGPELPVGGPLISAMSLRRA